MQNFYDRCSNYDGIGEITANDITNMLRYFVGSAPATFTGAHRRALSNTVPPVFSVEPLQLIGYPSSNTYKTLNVTITPPNNEYFTSLRISLKTDGRLKTAAYPNTLETVDHSQMFTPLGGPAYVTATSVPIRDNVYSIISDHWSVADYTNDYKQDDDIQGFVLALMSTVGTPSPASVFLLLETEATFIEYPIVNETNDLADANSPSVAFPIPVLQSSLLIETPSPPPLSPQPSPPSSPPALSPPPSPPPPLPAAELARSDH